MMIKDCEAATLQAERRRRLDEVSADVLDKSAELYRRVQAAARRPTRAAGPVWDGRYQIDGQPS